MTGWPIASGSMPGQLFTEYSCLLPIWEQMREEGARVLLSPWRG